MMNFLYGIRGLLVTMLLVINMLVSASIIFIAAGVAWLTSPFRFHHDAMSLALKFPMYWMFLNQLILKISTFGKWDIEGVGNLTPKGWYVLIANHQSWIDIPVLGSVFNRKLPLLKFFMKKALLWQLPIAGIDCYLLGYPLMARHSREDIRKNPKLKGKDIETVKQACEKFKEHPTTFMNFIEGTRFTEEKHDRQASPYHNLLKPKAAGIAVVTTEMKDKLDGIVNVTIHYDADDKSMWHLLCGKVRKIYIRYEVLPVSDEITGNYYEDRLFRKDFQQWLNAIWEAKDQMITAFKNAR